MDIIDIFKDIALTSEEPLEIIVVEAKALPYYGVNYRSTMDIDAEVIKGDVEKIYAELKNMGYVSDLSENINGWSVISMPKGYRERAVEIYKDEKLKISVLNPYDFIIMKLRRGTNQDIEDALSVALETKVSIEQLDDYFQNALESSIKDTALFNFKLIYNTFKNLLLEKLKTLDNI
ncbi:MAG: hypothetical protein C0170_00625 [Hydrogenobaculum sp.]|nr:MAG: hypothetical protein C0170_00625 [Hydrogenobaculum sp.]